MGIGQLKPNISTPSGEGGTGKSSLTSGGLNHSNSGKSNICFRQDVDSKQYMPLNAHTLSHEKSALQQISNITPK